MRRNTVIAIVILALVAQARATASAPTLETYRPYLTPEVREAAHAAWRLSRCGFLRTERAVLVVAVPNDPDGAVEARLLPNTFEERRITFRWQMGTRAILHTHPNDSAPEPSENDRRLADEQHIPIFTITIKGLYVYDPYFRQTVQLSRGTGWMDR